MYQQRESQHTFWLFPRVRFLFYFMLKFALGDPNTPSFLQILLQNQIFHRLDKQLTVKDHFND